VFGFFLNVENGVKSRDVGFHGTRECFGVILEVFCAGICIRGVSPFAPYFPPPQKFLAVLACFFGQVVGVSEGLVRSVFMVLEEEGRRGAMRSVGHLTLVEAFLKMAAPSDLSSSSLWCCASAVLGSPPSRRDEM
jgi:hypothetical protein